MMKKNQTEIISLLRSEAQKVYDSQCQTPANAHQFTGDKNIDTKLCDIKNHPYMFVLACVMDRQINAQRAWSIPHIVCEHFQVKSFNDLASLSEAQIIDFFTNANIHRFDATMGHCFYAAVQRIKVVYNGDVSKIWRGNPSSAAVVYQFLCFEGVGVKIATMAANILSRAFHIPFSDMSAIDVSPDVQVCRILHRLGLTETTDPKAAIYKAKEINPSFPGLIDLACWKWGREFCHPNNPECKKCPMNKVCSKQGV